MKIPRWLYLVVLALPLLLLGTFGLISTVRGESVTEKDYIGGDGGPMIVLQESATSKWQGAADFENSLMNGGNVETDYDVICEAQGKKQLIKRYNRDMLVLEDSEWGAYLFTQASGATVIVQQYGGENEPIEKIVERETQKRPSKSFRMKVQDRSLRLLVGADDGKGSMYSYKDVAIQPGTKRCDVFASRNYLVILIKPL